MSTLINITLKTKPCTLHLKSSMRVTRWQKEHQHQQSQQSVAIPNEITQMSCKLITWSIISKAFISSHFDFSTAITYFTFFLYYFLFFCVPITLPLSLHSNCSFSNIYTLRSVRLLRECFLLRIDLICFQQPYTVGIFWQIRQSKIACGLREEMSHTHKFPDRKIRISDTHTHTQVRDFTAYIGLQKFSYILNLMPNAKW